MPQQQARNIAEKIFDIRDSDQFNGLALELFHFQHRFNKVYREYCGLIGIDASEVMSAERIPFMPVAFYKTQRIAVHDMPPALEFRSSGTTGHTRSTHAVFDVDLYTRSILEGFNHFYGSVEECCILALIPPREERPDSSLAFMADVLIRESGCPVSGFYIGREADLPGAALSASGKKLLVFGTGSALSAFCETLSARLPDAIVVETGGTKGMRREMVREELHALLKKGFGTENIHSEYSMCELFSQAYSRGGGIFQCPPWMKVLPREISDPLRLGAYGATGGLNIIDLANMHTCAFIATQDACRVYADGRFEVLGRIDHSELRGCSLMTPDEGMFKGQMPKK